MSTSQRSRKLFCLWLSLSCALIAADQWVKALIVQHFSYGDSVIVTSFFNVVRAHNTGAAFSFLADAGGWQHWFFIGIATLISIVILFMLWLNSTHKMTAFALACILAGAIGNVIDRVCLGYVVDFLDFHWKGTHFPAFNVADIAITVGAGFLILNEITLLKKERSKK